MIWYYQSKSSQYVGLTICLLNSSILWHTCSCYWRYDLTRCLQPVYGRLWGTPATSVKRFVELQITTTFRQYQRDAAIKQWSRVKFDWTSRYHLLCSSLRFISLLYVRPTVSKLMSLNRYYTLVVLWGSTNYRKVASSFKTCLISAILSVVHFGEVADDSNSP